MPGGVDIVFVGFAQRRDAVSSIARFLHKISAAGSPASWFSRGTTA